MAVHALAIAQPPGWPRIAARAIDWLWSMQKDEGSWIEPDACGPVHLTVLVLDAIALANGAEHVTFRWRPVLPLSTRSDQKELGVEPGRNIENLPSSLKPLEVTQEASGIAKAQDANIASKRHTERQEVPAVTLAQQRRAAVDAYIEEIFDKTGERITRSNIWKKVGYKDRSDFERWERNDPKATKAAHDRFTRILFEKPHLK
jgi:hypothetical protein